MEYKTALILGAKSDIAQAIAYELAKKSTQLMLASREPKELEATAADLRIRFGIRAESLAFDALDFNSHPDFYNKLPMKADLVICVFGYLGDQGQAEQDRNEMFRILHTNYSAAVSILELAAADFEARKSGAIIGISSVAGDRGRQSNYFYGSSKAGFSAYLSGLRNRLATKGVHVMTVKPGFVRTAMTEGMKLPPFITAEAAQIGKAVIRDLQKKRNVVYRLWMWRYIMFLIRNIPEGLFKKMKL